MRGFLVTGTDTDVGKTWFMLKFGALLERENQDFHFLKPVESGCIEPNGDIIPKDAVQFSKLENAPLTTICKYMFKAYASPPKAAEMEGKSINIDQILDFIDKNKENDKNFINIVEGCGGFFSPIAQNKLTADLAESLKLPIILVVKNTLGCINHTLLSIQAIKKLNLDLKVIVLNNMSENTPLDNYSEISNYTNIPVVKLKYNQELTKEILKYIK
tara:strand:+ start:3669 stop:4316 length:648 start_codon:yes stop_codon:yes gene_type:complete